MKMKKIFISIASYRDPELQNTVQNILENAEFPTNLRIIVFEQNDEKDKSVYGMFPVENVTVLRTHFSNAKGPSWARYIIQKLFNNEEYYLQIDSHSRLIKNWDTVLIHMLTLVPEPAVLTQYPPEYNFNDIYDRNKIRSGLYVKGFSPIDGFTRINSHYSKDFRNFPYTSKAWSACFSFSKGSIVKDSPYDGSLEFLFFGEEMDITLRLFTRGYYFYSPHKNVIFTMFNRKYRRTFWQDINKEYRKEKELKSINILRERIFKLSDETGSIYGLGNLRTITDYEKFSEIEDIKLKKIKRNQKIV
jgi:[Skp1-protein]-hydroxyproline N-acetylglucosaminyltransferase